MDRVTIRSPSIKTPCKNEANPISQFLHNCSEVGNPRQHVLGIVVDTFKDDCAILTVRSRIESTVLNGKHSGKATNKTVCLLSPLPQRLEIESHRCIPHKESNFTQREDRILERNTDPASSIYCGCVLACFSRETIEYSGHRAKAKEMGKIPCYLFVGLRYSPLFGEDFRTSVQPIIRSL